MSRRAGETLADAAAGALPEREAALFALLHKFTAERLRSVDELRERILAVAGPPPQPASSRCLHAFLRESWECLDALGREVNACMQHVFPGAGLFPPLQMTRQCTFYVVRKKLHEAAETRRHPVSRLLWLRTRDPGDAAYERLSFLYNLSLFLAVGLSTGGHLPGPNDVPAAASGIIRVPDGGATGSPTAEEGTAQIADWLHNFSEDCYEALTQALQGDR